MRTLASAQSTCWGAYTGKRGQGRLLHPCHREGAGVGVALRAHGAARTCPASALGATASPLRSASSPAPGYYDLCNCCHPHPCRPSPSIISPISPLRPPGVAPYPVLAPTALPLLCHLYTSTGPLLTASLWQHPLHLYFPLSIVTWSPGNSFAGHYFHFITFFEKGALLTGSCHASVLPSACQSARITDMHTHPACSGHRV